MVRLQKEYNDYPGMFLEVLINRCDIGAFEAIKYCSDILPPERAFKEAMARLELFYGNKLDIMDAHMKHLCRGERVKYTVQGFQRFLTELQNFSIVLCNGDNDRLMASMNTIRRITNRLPYESKEVLTRDLQGYGKQLPTFEELLRFMESELRHVANPTRSNTYDW